MKGRNIWFVGGLWAALAGGCATTHGGVATRAADVRGSMKLSANQPRVAVSGPAHLLHVEYAEDADLELFSVERRAGQADCSGPVRARVQLHANRPNLIDADVPAGQVVCLAAGEKPGRREVAVSWHATVGPDGPRTLAAAFGLASVRP